MALFMLGPGVLRGLMAGQLWGYNTHSAAVNQHRAPLLVPAAMAYLALVLNAAASRWTNAVVAAISALTALSTLISQPAGVSGVNFVGIVGILVEQLIIRLRGRGHAGLRSRRSRRRGKAWRRRGAEHTVSAG